MWRSTNECNRRGKPWRALRQAVLGGTLCLGFLGAGLMLGAPLQAAYRWAFPAPLFGEGDFDALYREQGKPVVLFSTSTCPYCRATRELLTAAHVDFRELSTDQSASARSRFVALGGDAVPLLYIGRRRIVGYQPQVIRESLALAAAPAP